MSTPPSFMIASFCWLGAGGASGSFGLAMKDAAGCAPAIARKMEETTSGTLVRGISGERLAMRRQYETPGGQGWSRLMLPSAVSMPRQVVNRLR